VWEREGDNVVDAIAYAVGLPDDLAASDIQTILSERHWDFDNAAMGIEEEFDSESCYERNEPNAGQWHGEWYYFQDSLKTQTRFFSQSASALLKSIFNGVDEIETDNCRCRTQHKVRRGFQSSRFSVRQSFGKRSYATRQRAWPTSSKSCPSGKNECTRDIGFLWC